MKCYSNEYFDIFYNACDEDYIQLIIDTLNDSIIDYMTFFNLTTLEKKIQIRFYDKLDDFKIYYERTRKHPYRSGRVGSAVDNEIHILSLKERLLERPNDTLDTFIMGIKHELVHICHIAYKGNSRGSWFAEGLATNLGSPRYEETLDGCDLQTLFNKPKYKYCYTITKYMLENYSKEKILEYAKDDKLLIADTPRIFEEAKRFLERIKQ